MRAVWFMCAGALLSAANIVAGWSWALADAEVRVGNSGPQGIDWSDAALPLGVATAVTIMLTVAAILRLRGHDVTPRILSWIAAITMGLLFFPCGLALIADSSGMIDGTSFDPWAWVAHLIGMFLALPVVVFAVWLDKPGGRYRRDRHGAPAPMIGSDISGEI
ncbi:MAG: hypothetical protein HOV79_11695 [Hamadaea sp.]|nr:hypothetical protein [Hamadaea sp.]